jgi:hypothetical protein
MPTKKASKKAKPPKPPKKKVREPERDYSHRSLMDKLGVRDGQTIAVVGVEDPNFLDDLADSVPEFCGGPPNYACDLIFYAVRDRADLLEVKNLARQITRAGAIWAVYPKGKPELVRDVDIIATAKAAGLIDNKVCRFSETHTALRLCVPVTRR